MPKCCSTTARRSVGGAAGYPGPYAESSSLDADLYRSIRAMPGVARAPMSPISPCRSAGAARWPDKRQRRAGDDCRRGSRRAGHAGPPALLLAGRQLVRGHYEAVTRCIDRAATGRADPHPPAGTRWWAVAPHAVSSGGDPMCSFRSKMRSRRNSSKDNDAIVRQRTRHRAQPRAQQPGPACCPTVQALQDSYPTSTRFWPSWRRAAIRLAWPSQSAAGSVCPPTRPQMEEILAADCRLGLPDRHVSPVILAIVSAAIVAFIIYTPDHGQIRKSRCSS